MIIILTVTNKKILIPLYQVRSLRTIKLLGPFWWKQFHQSGEERRGATKLSDYSHQCGEEMWAVRSYISCK